MKFLNKFYSSKSSIAVGSFCDLNCKKHHTPISIMKYAITNFHLLYQNFLCIVRSLISIRSFKVCTISIYHRHINLLPFQVVVHMFLVIKMMTAGEVQYMNTIFRVYSFIWLSRHLYTLDKTCVNAKPNQTLEVIMTELDPEKMKIFYQENTDSASEATKVYLICFEKVKTDLFSEIWYW